MKEATTHNPQRVSGTASKHRSGVKCSEFGTLAPPTHALPTETTEHSRNVDNWKRTLPAYCIPAISNQAVVSRESSVIHNIMWLVVGDSSQEPSNGCSHWNTPRPL